MRPHPILGLLTASVALAACMSSQSDTNGGGGSLPSSANAGTSSSGNAGTSSSGSGGASSPGGAGVSSAGIGGTSSSGSAGTSSSGNGGTTAAAPPLSVEIDTTLIDASLAKAGASLPQSPLRVGTTIRIDLPSTPTDRPVIWFPNVGWEGDSEEGVALINAANDPDALVLPPGGIGPVSGRIELLSYAQSCHDGLDDWRSPFTATSTADTHAPIVTLQLPGAHGPRLPWEIGAAVSEGVDPTALQAAITLRDAGVPVGVDWTPVGVVAGSTIELLGWVHDWASHTGSLDWSVAAGLVDPTGNTSIAASGSVAPLALPAGIAKHDFTDGSATVGMWGSAMVDPTCAGDGCAVLGTDPASQTGIAGLLSAPGMTSVHVRYSCQAASPMGTYFSGMSVDVAIASGIITQKLDCPYPPNGSGGSGGSSAGAAFEEAVVTLPDAVDSAGFAIYASPLVGCHDSRLIDWVAAE